MKAKVFIALILSLVMLVGVACGPATPATTTKAPAETDTPKTDAPATDAPETDPPKTEAAPEESDEAPSEKPLVGISVPNNPTGWVAAVQWAARETAERLDLNYRLVASANANEQANQIDELISLGCEYIVLFPQNDELEVAAKKIMDAGIVLVNFDRTLGDLEPDYYIAGNNKQMGELGASYIAEKLDGKGKVVIMNIPNYGAIFTERVDGFKEVIADSPDIEVLGEYAADNGAPETVLPVMADVLTKYPELDGIYSTDDEMSKGILQAIREAGREDIKVITGGGGDKTYFALMDEYTDIWVSSQTYAPYMIIDCVELVDGLIKGETYESRIIIPAQNIDRTNYKQYLEENNITEDAPY